MRSYLSSQKMYAPNPVKAMNVILTGEYVEKPKDSKKTPVIPINDDKQTQLGFWSLIWRALKSFFGIASIVVLSCSIGNSQNVSIQQDTVQAQFIGDLLGVANSLLSTDKEDPVRRQRAEKIKLKNYDRWVDQIEKLNKRLEKGDILPYQYDVVMAKLLDINIIEVKQLRALTQNDEG